MAQPSISANERALLNTIRYAEGTWHGGGTKGYGTMFGGGQFDWSKGHPDRVVRSGGYASAAAGAYQFMPDTWNAVSKQLGLKDFSPDSQDRAALQLARNRGVDPSKPLTTDALAKLAPEWASLPTAAGKSYYGQPVKKHGELFNFYGGSGATGGQATGGTATGGTATPPPPPLTAGTGGLIGSSSGIATGGIATGGIATDSTGLDLTPGSPTRPRPIEDEASSPMLAALRRNTELLNTPNPFLRTPANKRSPGQSQRMAGGIASLLNGFQSLLGA